MTDNQKNTFKVFVIVCLAIAVILVYMFIDPGESNIFPKCIYRSITGLKCPGCGAQRCIHSILTGDFPQAFRQNALFVVSIPFIIFGTLVSIFKNKNARWGKIHKACFSIPVAITVSVITIAFTVCRNIYGF